MAYDRLIAILSDRETAIEKTMAKQVEHYGLTERVLHTGRNFAREQE